MCAWCSLDVRCIVNRCKTKGVADSVWHTVFIYRQIFLKKNFFKQNLLKPQTFTEKTFNKKRPLFYVCYRYTLGKSNVQRNKMKWKIREAKKKVPDQADFLLLFWKKKKGAAAPYLRLLSTWVWVVLRFEHYCTSQIADKSVAGLKVQPVVKQ